MRTRPPLPVTKPAVFQDAPAIQAFADWLFLVGETQAHTSQKLYALFAEHCEFLGKPTPTKGQLFRHLRGTRIERFREPVGRRRWMYKLKVY